MRGSNRLLFWGPPPRESLSFSGDLNRKGDIDQGAVEHLIKFVSGGPNPEGSDPDFNRDGNADQGDIDALINAIAGGGCP